MHFEHKPAEVMMVDFAGDNISYVDKASGEVISCPVFVGVLPCSGYSFAVALPNATQPNVIKALNLCLAYFGGVPHSIMCLYAWLQNHLLCHEPLYRSACSSQVRRYIYPMVKPDSQNTTAYTK